MKYVTKKSLKFQGRKLGLKKEAILLFNSTHFFIFFPIIATFNFLIPHKYRWLLLLVASYYFYMAWNPCYIILIILSTFVDYCMGYFMGREEIRYKRKKYLYVSIFVNLGLLFVFKYYDFFSEFVRAILFYFGVNYEYYNYDLLLPMGISFYTFQTLSYTIDVYNEKIKPEKHYGIFSLYVSFFPQLVAGPIERSGHLIPQFKKNKELNSSLFFDGIHRIFIGLFKKIVIADRLAVVVDKVYSNPTAYTGVSLAIGTVFFAFQIYCDFSGYSDMAIGTSKVLGYDLMENFKRPYFSKSITEFWKRWHISLSSWFKDYVYIPLGGSKVRLNRYLFNLMLTFLISGLWHGANLTFIVWGGLHGLFVISENLARRVVKYYDIKFSKLIRPGINFLRNISTFILICYAWIFFRANNISDAFYISQNIFNDIPQFGNWDYVMSNVLTVINDVNSFIVTLFTLMMFVVIELISEVTRKDWIKFTGNSVVKYIVYYVFLMYIFVFGVFGEAEFMYFQF